MKHFDNTILSDFKRCMRYGYFKHVKGWQPEGTSPALIFGSAWHAAMDVVWEELAEGKNDNELAVARRAMDKFQEEWEAEGGPAQFTPLNLREWSPRIPQTAALMLENYIAKHRAALRHLTLIKAEELFAVPLDDGVHYVGRRDKLVRNTSGKHIIVEHKTTAWGTKSGFKAAWSTSWTGKSQIDGYLFSAGHKYPNLSLSVWIDAALVHTTEHKTFDFIPVVRTMAHLDAWLWETRYWVGTIRQHLAALAEADTDAEFMAAFPRNTESCIQFNRRCPYFDTCVQHTNPEACTRVPLGMEVRHWSPGTPEELAAITGESA